MTRRVVWMRKILLSTLITLVFSTALVLVGTSSSIPTITEMNPATTVYLDPPTINGTAVGVDKTVTVNIMIRDASEVYAWQIGLIFNKDLLECTGFFEGDFLKNVGITQFPPVGVINNTAGMVRPPYYCTLLGDVYASYSGILAYATFNVSALGVSDIHLIDVQVYDYNLNIVPVNIIDVYTVDFDTTSHRVVMVSNLTGGIPEYISGFYGHAFNPTLNETSFKTGGPDKIVQESGTLEISGSFSNVTIPKTLLPPPESPRVWAVIINGIALSIEEIIKSENTTHTSVYFTFPPGENDVRITTRFRPSSILIALSEESIPLGESVTISGAIDPVRPGVTVTIYNRMKGDVKWSTLANVTTNPSSEYTHEWEPGKKGIYEVMASWEGDLKTLRDDSDVKTLEVKGKGGDIPLEIVAVVVVAVIVVASIVVYFVKIRKPKSE